MARYAVLVSFDAAGLALSIVAQIDQLVRDVEDGALVFPPKRQVGCRDNLDKVHEVVGFLIRLLIGAIKRVEVVVTPSHALLADLGDRAVWQLWAETKVVDLVCEGVLDSFPTSKVVFEVVDVHVAIAEGLARGEVEVADDFVDPNSALDTASLPALFVQMFGVVLALALLYILATPERPGDACVGVADLGASVTASCLDRVGRGGSTIALSAVRGIEVCCGFVSVSEGALWSA